MSIADLRPALRAFLLADAPISAAVGGARIFPVVLQQGERGASLVYNLVSEATDYHLRGPSGLVQVRMQIDAYAPTPNDAWNLAGLVKGRLSGYRGLMGSITVQGVFADVARADYHDGPKLHRVNRDFMIHYGEL
jgi:hypothetical protein